MASMRGSNPYTNVARMESSILASFSNRMLEAKRHQKQGRLGSTVTALSSAIFLKPRNADLYRQKAEVYIKLCDFKSALLNYKKALALQPADIPTRSRKAAIHFVREDSEWKEALVEYEEAIKLQPMSRDYRMGRLRVWLHDKLFKSALEELCYILQDNPKDVEALIMRAKLMCQSRRYARAKRDLDAACLIEPGNSKIQRVRETLADAAKALYNQASAYLINGEYEQALSYINDSILLHPDVACYELRASIFRYLRQFSSAIADLKTAMTIAQGGVENKNVSLEKLRNVQKLLGVTLNDIGCSLIGMQKHREAITCFSKAISRDSSAAAFHVNLAKSYEALNELDNALKFYENALTLIRSQGRIHSDMGKDLISRLARLRFERGRRMFNATCYLEAESEFSEAVDLQPDTAIFVYNRGESRLHLLNFIAAYHDFKKAANLNPNLHSAVERFDWIKGKIDPANITKPKASSSNPQRKRTPAQADDVHR